MTTDEKIACEKDRFCTFVANHERYTEEEVLYLQRTIINKKLSRILYVSASLGIWSMIAAWVDLVILPFIIVYTVALPGASYYPMLFPIIWTVFNAFFKFLYVRRQLRGAVSLRDNALAVLPYAGAAFLLKNWFIGDTLLRGASLEYINHQKKQVSNKLFRKFRRQ